MDNDELLKYILDNGMIDVERVKAEIKMQKRKKLLSQHPYSIYHGSDDYWHTYVPVENGPRRAIKKKNREDLEDFIIGYDYFDPNFSFKRRYEIWVKRQEMCGLSDNTICRYMSDYKRFFEGSDIEKMDVRKMTSDDINLFIRRLLDEQDIPFRTLKAIGGYLNGTFKKCVIDRTIDSSPMDYVDLPVFKRFCKEREVKTARERTLTSEEKRALITHLRKSKSPGRFAAELALFTGMRVGELSALKWEDIDYEKQFIRICRSEKYSRTTGEYYISDTKNGKIRYIPLTDGMIDVLDRTKKDAEEGGYLSEFVFSCKKGKVHNCTISECVRNNTMSKEFSTVKSIHAIRRTINSNMRCAGTPVTVASAILGHSERVNELNYTYDIVTIEQKKEFLESAICL